MTKNYFTHKKSKNVFNQREYFIIKYVGPIIVTCKNKIQ